MKLTKLHKNLKLKSFPLISYQNLFNSKRTYATIDGVNHVTVFGSGLMGSGIVQVSAAAGYNVTMVDINNEVLEKSKSAIKNSLSRVAKKKYADNQGEADKYIEQTFNRISISTNAEGKQKNI